MLENYTCFQHNHQSRYRVRASKSLGITRKTQPCETHSSDHTA